MMTRIDRRGNEVAGGQFVPYQRPAVTVGR
jgi:hypothetical protein